MMKQLFLLTLVVLTGLALAACGSASGKKTITYSRVVDLSQPIHPNIPLWPGDPPVEFEEVANFATHGYYLRRFSIGEHSATHMNASNSFVEDGQGIDAYSPESLVVPAVVIDIRDKAAANIDYALTVEDVLAWEKKYGKIPAGSLVLLYTGWQDKWDDPASFFNPDENGGLHFPGFSAEATLFLFDERKVAGMGIDTHGVDPGQDVTFFTNVEIAKRNAIALECLGNLDQLPPKGATLVIGILRLQNGSGSPVSVMAFVP
ncbi:MAG: cyclase family protein [Anaerolineales bacterium]|nr:cyclase family protein [Anaerolineales bacterium]MCX7608228.1 cyclase family protein [Anaerolineales bacterium]MDW8228115.1 cyclase family protein [Anaerolineales bacterium]